MTPDWIEACLCADRLSEDWSGQSGVGVEDWVPAVSMGPVFDRTKEHVVAADRAVMHPRAKLPGARRRCSEPRPRPR